MRLLVLEDDLQVARGLAEGLGRAGYAVTHVCTPSEADQAIQRERFDIAIVDLGLPHEDGLSFIRRMRDQGVALPMLIVTARDTLDDCVAGLDAGADDYLTKPFRMPELLARLRAAARRQHSDVASHLTVGPLEINLRTHEIRHGDEMFELPLREREVLESLMIAAPSLVKKDSLIQSVAGWQADVSSNAIEVYISRLRPKIEPLGFIIRSIRGIGYRLEFSKP